MFESSKMKEVMRKVTVKEVFTKTYLVSGEVWEKFLYDDEGGKPMTRYKLLEENNQYPSENCGEPLSYVDGVKTIIKEPTLMKDTQKRELMGVQV